MSRAELEVYDLADTNQDLSDEDLEEVAGGQEDWATGEPGDGGETGTGTDGTGTT